MSAIIALFSRDLRRGYFWSATLWPLTERVEWEMCGLITTHTHKCGGRLVPETNLDAAVCDIFRARRSAKIVTSTAVWARNTLEWGHKHPLVSVYLFRMWFYGVKPDVYEYTKLLDFQISISIRWRKSNTTSPKILSIQNNGATLSNKGKYGKLFVGLYINTFCDLYISNNTQKGQHFWKKGIKYYKEQSKYSMALVAKVKQFYPSAWFVT